MLLYHGTPAKIAALIEKERFIRPRGEAPGRYKGKYASRPHCVYLTTQHDVAFYHATHDTGKGMIYVVEIPWDELQLDEDMIYLAYQEDTYDPKLAAVLQDYTILLGTDDNKILAEYIESHDQETVDVIKNLSQSFCLPRTIFWDEVIEAIAVDQSQQYPEPQ